MYAQTWPINIIFHNVNEYATMAEASGAAETDMQLIDIGLIIITNANIFGSNIRKCHSKPAEEKARTNLKSHFTTAQRRIKRSQPPKNPIFRLPSKIKRRQPRQRSLRQNRGKTRRRHCTSRSNQRRPRKRTSHARTTPPNGKFNTIRNLRHHPNHGSHQHHPQPQKLHERKWWQRRRTRTD